MADEYIVKSNGHYSPLLTHMMNKRKEAPQPQPKQEPVDLSQFYCGAARIRDGEYKLMDMRTVDALAADWCPIYAIPEHLIEHLYTTPPAAPVQEPYGWVSQHTVKGPYEWQFNKERAGVYPDNAISILPVYTTPPATDVALLRQALEAMINVLAGNDYDNPYADLKAAAAAIKERLNEQTQNPDNP